MTYISSMILSLNSLLLKQPTYYFDDYADLWGLQYRQFEDVLKGCVG